MVGFYYGSCIVWYSVSNMSNGGAVKRQYVNQPPLLWPWVAIPVIIKIKTNPTASTPPHCHMLTPPLPLQPVDQRPEAAALAGGGVTGLAIAGAGWVGSEEA